MDMSGGSWLQASLTWSHAHWLPVHGHMLAVGHQMLWSGEPGSHPRWDEGTLSDNVQVPMRSLNRAGHKERRTDKGASFGGSVLGAQCPSPPSGVPSRTGLGARDHGLMPGTLEGEVKCKNCQKSHAAGPL